MLVLRSELLQHPHNHQHNLLKEASPFLARLRRSRRRESNNQRRRLRLLRKKSDYQVVTTQQGTFSMTCKSPSSKATQPTRDSSSLPAFGAFRDIPTILGKYSSGLVSTWPAVLSSEAGNISQLPRQFLSCFSSLGSLVCLSLRPQV